MAESEQSVTRDVAVVFVHGIGAQLRGETLTEWAEPLARRLALIARSEGGELEVESTQLEDVHAETTLLIRDRQGQRRIFMLEARWADSFVLQSDTAFIRWSVSFAGRALGRCAAHVWRLGYSLGRATLLSRSERTVGSRILRTLVGIGRAIALIPYAAILVVLAPAIYLVAVLGLLGLGLLARVPYISRWARPMIVALNTTIGDAAVWTTRPVSAGAIRTTVRDALARGRAQAGRTIVVAHSQGAAVAADLIFSERENVHTLITVGGAVLLLRKPRWSLAEVTPQTPVAAWSNGGTRWINIWATWDPVPSGPVADRPRDVKRRWQEAVVASAERAIYEKRQLEAMKAVDGRHRTTSIWDTLVRASLPTEVQGGDFPLPHPSFDTGEDTVAGPAERPVYNRCSLLTDHVTYTANILEVIDPIARAILGAPVADEDPEQTPESDEVTIHRLTVTFRSWLRISGLLVAATFAAPLTAAIGGVDWWERLRALVGSNNTPAMLFSMVDANTVGVAVIAMLVGAALFGGIVGVGSLILSFGREQLNWPRALPRPHGSLWKSIAALIVVGLLMMSAFYMVFLHWIELGSLLLAGADGYVGGWELVASLAMAMTFPLVIFAPVMAPTLVLRPAILPERRAPNSSAMRERAEQSATITADPSAEPHRRWRPFRRA